jgi:ADP-ribose pyrophosphatase YjhB (NUDIX family)
MKETKSAGGVVVWNSLVLLVNQKGSSWSLPKGHVENGEDAMQAAKREIHEESGIDDLLFVKELGSYQRYRIGENGIGEDRSEKKTITIFMFKTSQESLKPIDPENPEARWVKKEEVANLLTHVKDRKFFLSIIKEI